MLLVEDDTAILKISTHMLENMGYRVICAKNPEDAIALAWENKERLDLLITDVIIPAMNGRELSNQISAFCPDLKVIYILIHGQHHCP